MLYLLYTLSVLAIIQGIVSLIEGLRNLRYYKKNRRPVTPSPGHRVIVFCPCKDDDGELEANVHSLLDQDYPDYRVVFIVESEDDRACKVLARIGVSDILFAGQAQNSGQKVHNLIRGVDRHGHEADILVFCDSDARFPRSWLSDILLHLSDTNVGVSTGYRWYIPLDSRLPTLLRSAWNAPIVGMLGPHHRNFAWGGSMAIRRETFDRARVRDAWTGAVSDDYAVTRAVRRAGMTVVYVPTCLVPTYDRCSWSELFEFTNRQVTITRVYSPRLWQMGLLTQSIFNLSFVPLTVLLFFNATALLLWAAIYGLAAAKAWTRLAAVRRVIQHPSLAAYAWFYVLSPPLVALLYQYNLIHSTFSRNISWQGIRYTLVSPQETRICRLPENTSVSSKV